MPGFSASTIERVMHDSRPDVGWEEDLVVSNSMWRMGDGTTVIARADGGVGVGAIATSFNGIIWDDTADASDTVRLDLALPGQFKQAADDTLFAPVLKFLAKCRVRDLTGSATANTDLALTAQMYFHNEAETSIQSLAAVVSNIIGATDYADATEEGFAWYTFDLYAACSAAQKLLLKPLTTVQIVLAPDQTVGTNLYLEMLSSVIRYRRHCGIATSSRSQT